MFQNEYRQENKNSSFIADFAYTKGYKSKLSNNRNGMSHLFSKYDLDLGLKDFLNSKLNILVEKVSMDTYLKVFENAISTDETFESNLKDHNTMETSVKLSLDHDNYNLTSGFTSYEKLQTTNNSDRYQYVFPYYDFSTSLLSNEFGELNFTSNGNNSLKDTNNLKTVITNDFQYKSFDTYSKAGFVSNFGIYLKNLNTIAKNDSKYKSSPQSKFLNINEFSLSYPLIKNNNKNYDYLIPKISFRINPSNMKSYSSDSRLITTDNVFSINRLGLSETYESGKSLTLGLDYKKEEISNNEKFLEIKFAGVLRDSPEYKIPQSSSLQGQTSNFIGSIENKFSKYLTFNYDFSLDNDLNTIEHNNLKTEFKVNNFVTEFNFHESNGKIGSSNFLSNETSISFNDNNYLKFKTRRNRKISLTEYYDFVYEYQNDCLTAALKYRKTYYQDRDAIPKEDLFFTVTLFPLATIDQKIERSVVALTKTGDVILLDVKNGKPIHENSFQYIAVPQSDVPREKTAAFQKKFFKPEPYSNTVIDLEEDFSHLDQENLNYVQNKLRFSKSQFFLPPSIDHDVILYGLHGGAEWFGGAIDFSSTNPSLIVPYNRDPWIIRAFYTDKISRLIDVIAEKVNVDASVMKDISFKFKKSESNLVMMLVSEEDSKVVMSIMITDDLVKKGMNAGELIKVVSKEVNGDGGGQSFFATAGGSKLSGISSTIQTLKQLI